jgi:hypothetical protein
MNALRHLLICQLALVGLACGNVDPGEDEPATDATTDATDSTEPTTGPGETTDGSGGEGSGASSETDTTEPTSSTTPEPEPDLPRYMPLAEGMSWTYDVTDNGITTRKVTTVGPEEPVGGSGPNADKLAFKVTTEKNDGTDETVSWQTRIGDLAIRYREQAFGGGSLQLEEFWAPHKLRLDESTERLVEGANWGEEFEETKLAVNQPAVTATRVDRWTVLAVDESVTVPAGTFDALVVQKVGSASNKVYWFARGVGKVKEEGGQTEELVSFESP